MRVEVGPKTAVPAVIEHWADLDAEQIKEIVREFYERFYGDDDDDGELDLLQSLYRAKEIATVENMDELLRLWRVIESGEEVEILGGLTLNGLLGGESSGNYRKTRKFVEQLFAPKFSGFYEQAFNDLTLAASGLPTARGRAKAYDAAFGKLCEYSGDLEPWPPHMRNVEQLVKRVEALLTQLIDEAEEEAEKE